MTKAKVKLLKTKEKAWTFETPHGDLTFYASDPKNHTREKLLWVMRKAELELMQDPQFHTEEVS